MLDFLECFFCTYLDHQEFLTFKFLNTLNYINCFLRKITVFLLVLI